MRFDNDGVRLLPDPAFLAKNQSMTFSPEEIFLLSIGSISTIKEDRRWCPVRALRIYLDKTKHIRTSDRLFILPRAPHTPASKDTLARWLRTTISSHTTDPAPVRAHDVRGVAASRAWFGGVPVEAIMKAAAWKSNTTFVSCYLRNTRSPDGDFARAVLNPPRCGTLSHHR